MENMPVSAILVKPFLPFSFETFVSRRMSFCSRTDKYLTHGFILLHKKAEY